MTTAWVFLRGRRCCAAVLVCGAVSMLCACAGNPVRDVAVATGFGVARPEPAPFVSANRPESVGYLNVGVRPAGRPIPSRDPARLKELEAEMQGVKTGHQSSGRPIATPGTTLQR